MTVLRRLFSLHPRSGPTERDGQGLAEYALIAIIAIVALIFLGGQISHILSDVGHSM
jgi:hypothetical protein